MEGCTVLAKMGFSKRFLVAVLRTLAGLILLLFATADLHAATYYVDCEDGSDQAEGLSPARAWHTVAAVNNREFAPGDSILLRRGTRCPGSLSPKGSGKEGSPIRIGAYGKGPLPVVSAGAAQAAVKLFGRMWKRAQRSSLRQPRDRARDAQGARWRIRDAPASTSARPVNAESSPVAPGAPGIVDSPAGLEGNETRDARQRAESEKGEGRTNAFAYGRLDNDGQEFRSRSNPQGVGCTPLRTQRILFCL